MSRFSDYLQKHLISLLQAREVIDGMQRPIGKSIRVNTRKISLSEFRLHAMEQWWVLTETGVPEVFLIDRDDTSVALGNTIEHRAGWFYVQEVAAAHPPFTQTAYRSGTAKILDMCAAPGGKTTQLADYFPESLIIANEVNRTRTPQLFDNLDRMGYDNIAVVSCDGRFFQNFPGFDAVLLDAPCSGEGTAFRDKSIIDHWHEKNIDRIAKLQNNSWKQLIPSWNPEVCSRILHVHSMWWKMKKSSNTNSKRQARRENEKKILAPYRAYRWFFRVYFSEKNSSTPELSYPQLVSRGQNPWSDLRQKENTSS